MRLLGMQEACQLEGDRGYICCLLGSQIVTLHKREAIITVHLHTGPRTFYREQAISLALLLGSLLIPVGNLRTDIARASIASDIVPDSLLSKRSSMHLFLSWQVCRLCI